MRNVVSQPYALLFVMAAAYLTSACSKHEPVQAGTPKPADVDRKSVV